MEEYFEKLDYNKIKKQIYEFDNLNFNDISDLEIENKILDIITVDNKKYINSYLVEIPKGEIFYRIRRNYNFTKDIDKNNEIDILNFLGKPYPDIGRMNKKGEEGIYFSSNLETAMLECNIKNDDVFSLAIFENNQKIDLLAAFINNKYEKELSDENRKKAEMLNSFIYKYLLKQSKGDKNIYRITNVLKKIFSEVLQRDGTIYVSAKNKKDFNSHINKKFSYKLDLKYVFLVNKKNDNLKNLKTIKVIDNKKVSYAFEEKEINNILNSDNFIFNTFY